jgi:hypothetical protein
MISELDIYRAANLLLNRHGFDAMIEAARLLDITLDLHDSEARRVWLRVRKALEALEARSTGSIH